MRVIIFIITLLFVVSIYPAIGQAEPDVSAHNAILIDQSTGRVLFEKSSITNKNPLQVLQK